MRLLGGWLAKVPEYELKLEIGRHVWQDAQAAESLRVRTGELRIPADADRRPPVEVKRWLDRLDQAQTPLWSGQAAPGGCDGPAHGVHRPGV
jgi:hypothetical protein